MKKLFIVLVLTGLVVLGFHYLSKESSFPVTVASNPYKTTFQVQLDEALIEYDVYRFRKDQIQSAIYASNTPTSFLEWQSQLDDNVLINGGYFLEDYSPAGGLMINGVLFSERLYDLDKSGLIHLDRGKLSIIDTANDTSLDKYSSSNASYLQAYPFLIKQGEAAISEDSELLARRTVLATTKNDVLVIIVDRTPVSLFELTNMLIEQGLGIETAINLDGGPSTAFIYRDGDFEETSLPISGLPQILGLKLLR